jgi:hypothetical protein
MVAALLILAGCSGGGGFGAEDPTPLPTPELDADGSETPATATVTSASPDIAETDAGRAFLTGFDSLPIRSVTTANGAFRVTYVSNDSRLLRDGYLLGLAYGGTVDRTWRNASTWPATRMDGLAVRANGPPLARFRMPAAWPRQYFEGTISARTLTERLRAALERSDSDGQFRSRDGRLTEFSAAADRTAVDVASASTRNRTVFLTVRAPSDDRARLRAAVGEVVAAYGSTTSDWGTAALELSIRDRDDDFVGWYRADASFAANVSAGRANVTLTDRRFVAEEGRLLGPASGS